jgi:hypothetical protein
MHGSTKDGSQVESKFLESFSAVLSAINALPSAFVAAVDHGQHRKIRSISHFIIECPLQTFPSKILLKNCRYHTIFRLGEVEQDNGILTVGQMFDGTISATNSSKQFSAIAHSICFGNNLPISRGRSRTDINPSHLKIRKKNFQFLL